jgi:hypothetical protein
MINADIVFGVPFDAASPNLISSSPCDNEASSGTIILAPVKQEEPLVDGIVLTSDALAEIDSGSDAE